MKLSSNYHVAVTVFVSLSFINEGVSGGNLTCYQCKRNSYAECAPEELLPCASLYDRCVTHISKDSKTGFFIKRECGLGPCGFDDDMMNRGLGLGNCDRSRDEYFCIFCCRESGCNKNTSPSSIHPSILILTITISIFTMLLK